MSAPAPQATCAICGASMAVELILGHLRGAHDIDAEPETWPDGELVIVDETLTPEDFR